jgi:hypothetical protein
LMSDCCMTMLRYPKRALSENIWNRKRLSSFRTLLFSPDLAPCVFFLFPRLKKHLAGRKYQSRKKFRFGFLAVFEQYTSKRLWKRI